MKIGIMQGRLSDTPNNEDLDWFPIDSWENEFLIAKNLSFNSIELVIDRKMRNDNPIWHQTGRARIGEMYNRNNLSPFTCCVNFIIDYALSSEFIIGKVKELIGHLSELNFSQIIMPLFEASDPELNNSRSVGKSVNEIADYAQKKNIKLLIETNLSGMATVKFLSEVGNDDVGIVYDIGNATHCEQDIALDLDILTENIAHIHLKDKCELGKNVLLGSGKVNFDQFFNILKKNNYKGAFTLETSRGKSAVTTARKNIKFIREYYGS